RTRVCKMSARTFSPRRGNHRKTKAYNTLQRKMSSQLRWQKTEKRTFCAGVRTRSRPTVRSFPHKWLLLLAVLFALWNALQHLTTDRAAAHPHSEHLAPG